MIYIKSNDDDDGNVKKSEEEEENYEPQVVILDKCGKMLVITGCLLGFFALILAVIGVNVGWCFHQELWAGVGVAVAFACGLAAYTLATCKTPTTTRNLLVIICALIAIILNAIVILLLALTFSGILGCHSSKGGTDQKDVTLPACNCFTNTSGLPDKPFSLNKCINSTWPPICGVAVGRKKRIVHGSISPVGNHPWQVQILRKEGKRWKHLCGGTLIRKDVVLSAAHCFNSFADKQYTESDFAVATGQQYSLNRDGKEHIIKHIYIHDEFDRNSFINDIALILLEMPVAQLQPACLPSPLNKDDDDRGSGEINNGTLEFVVSGYGMTEDGSYSTQLRSASVKVVPRQHCQQEMNRSPHISMVIAPTNWCARAIKGSMNCIGDSGGPVIREFHGRVHVLVGIISWGRGCREPHIESYSVYTKVRCYLPWIHDRLKEPYSDCGSC